MDHVINKAIGTKVSESVSRIRLMLILVVVMVIKGCDDRVISVL